MEGIAATETSTSTVNKPVKFSLSAFRTKPLLFFPAKSQQEFLDGRFVPNQVFIGFWIHGTILIRSQVLSNQQKQKRFDLQETNKQKATPETFQRLLLTILVEVGGFEPPTPCMPCKCSPAELNPHKVTALIIRSDSPGVKLLSNPPCSSNPFPFTLHPWMYTLFRLCDSQFTYDVLHIGHQVIAWAIKITDPAGLNEAAGSVKVSLAPVIFPA